VEPKYKNLGKFYDAERAKRYHETSKQPLRKFTFLLVDAE
jgi:hypothetical protein